MNELEMSALSICGRKKNSEAATSVATTKIPINNKKTSGLFLLWFDFVESFINIHGIN